MAEMADIQPVTGRGRVADDLAKVALFFQLRLQLLELLVEPFEVLGPAGEDFGVVGELPRLDGHVDRGVDRVVDDPLRERGGREQKVEERFFHGRLGWVSGAADGAVVRCWFWMIQYCSFTACR